MSDISNILNTALTYYPNSIFYRMDDFKYDLLSINLKNRCLEFYLLFTSLGFSPIMRRPTVVSSSGKYLIDNVWTNNLNALKNSDEIF